MEERVIIDKNVILASSVYASTEVLETTVKHKYYEMSARFMNIIDENRELGYLTNEVENESIELLDKAMRDTVNEEEDLPDLEEMDEFYLVSSICNNRMSERIDICNRISLKRENYKPYVEEVRNMYIDLIEDFQEEFGQRPGEKAHKVAQKSDIYLENGTFDAIRDGYADEAFDTLRRKLIKSPPESEDKKLLGQTAMLNENRFEQNEVFLASCDQHFVEVQRAEESDNSDFIPEKIEDEFGVKCMWPDSLSEELDS